LDNLSLWQCDYRRPALKSYACQTFDEALAGFTLGRDQTGGKPNGDMAAPCARSIGKRSSVSGVRRGTGSSDLFMRTLNSGQPLLTQN